MSRCLRLSLFLCTVHLMCVLPSLAQDADVKIPPDERAVQFDEPQGVAALVETSAFIRANEARRDFRVDGTGLTVAVLDTGLNTTHVDFVGRIAEQRNFTTDNGGAANDATDGDGHGTNVAGIISADGDHTGIAPGSRVIPLKVLNNTGSGSFESIRDALQWVIDNRETHTITVVNVSIGDSQNHTADTFAGVRNEIAQHIRTLRDARVPVVISAGNDFFRHSSVQGMGFPAIVRDSISVGAVYDANIGPASYLSGAEASTTGAGRLTPFSQRLHATAPSGATLQTDIFAPGAPLTSAGISGDHGESIQHGTSQAAPTTAGVILLAQEYHHRVIGQFPTVDQVERWLQSGVVINDGDDEVDNVTNTGLNFIRLDALATLGAADGEIRGRLMRERAPLKR